MEPVLRMPFRLNGDNMLGMGAGGFVCFISRRVVFKFPYEFDNAQLKTFEESPARMANEKAVHSLLMKHPHPNIIRCILYIPKGFFMERMEMTLRDRLCAARSGNNAPSNDTQLRWITQLASALAWIEGLGLVHGDLRPANILVTADDDIRLADFDASVPIGEELVVASEPFCKMNANSEFSDAGPISEQFALGSCIYTIRYGHIPLHEVDPPERVIKLKNNEFPSTADDAEFGTMIMDCWQGKYASIAAVYNDIKERSGAVVVEEIAQDSSDHMASLLAECEDFLARGKADGTPQSRLH